MYVCSVIHKNINAVIPEVEINTTDTLVGIGNDVTITCFVLRGNPSIYMYTITNVNTGSTTTGSTLVLTDIQIADVGTYRCDVTNDAGTGTSNNTVTIELGGMKSNFSIPNFTHNLTSHISLNHAYPPVVTTIQLIHYPTFCIQTYLRSSHLRSILL